MEGGWEVGGRCGWKWRDPTSHDPGLTPRASRPTPRAPRLTPHASRLDPCASRLTPYLILPEPLLPLMYLGGEVLFLSKIVFLGARNLER